MDDQRDEEIRDRWLRLDRLAEWDENRVWLDGAWWTVEHFGHESDGICDAIIQRMDPQPQPAPGTIHAAYSQGWQDAMRQENPPARAYEIGEPEDD